MVRLALLPVLMGATQVLAVACANRSFTTCEDNIVHWYDIDDGQICDPLDCGGGRAPPRTDVPGCPQYKGTETRATSASYLSCFKSPGALESSVAPATPTAEAEGAEPTDDAGLEPTGVVVNTGSGSTSTLPKETTSKTGEEQPQETETTEDGEEVEDEGAEATPSPTDAPGAGQRLDGSSALAAAAVIGALALAQ